MKIYLDTNVIRDCLKRRRLDTIRVMEIIRERKIECKSSIFGIMELIDTEKDDVFFNNKIKKGVEVKEILRRKSQRDIKIDDLNDIWEQINNLLASYNFIQFVNIEGQGWNTAFDVCRASNLDADDSIHLVSAIGSGCNILLTSDEFLTKEGRRVIEEHNNTSETIGKIFLEIKNPEELLKLLEESKK